MTGNSLLLVKIASKTPTEREQKAEIFLRRELKVPVTPQSVHQAVHQQISYFSNPLKSLVGPAGLEPATRPL